MRSLVFFNNKGGVGKTTLLCNVAAYFSQEMGQKVCIIDCDPQCNASQYVLPDEILENLLEEKSRNIENIFSGLMAGEGQARDVPINRSESFGVDIVCGSPGLSMAEDFLAEDWGSINTIRGLSSTIALYRTLESLRGYDFVFLDVSPSLGAINRAVLLSSDYFVSPISVDIFSLKAFQNISLWMEKWRQQWEYAVGSPLLDGRHDVVGIARAMKGASFLGYVSQQYTAKRDATGERRPVKSFEIISQQIDDQIEGHFKDGFRPPEPFEIGKIPNLHSLAPMSQSRRKPIFSLTGGDGVVGAHFAKVKEAKDIFSKVSTEIFDRLVG